MVFYTRHLASNMAQPQVVGIVVCVGGLITLSVRQRWVQDSNPCLSGAKGQVLAVDTLAPSNEGDWDAHLKPLIGLGWECRSGQTGRQDSGWLWVVESHHSEQTW